MVKKNKIRSQLKNQEDTKKFSPDQEFSEEFSYHAPEQGMNKKQQQQKKH